MSTVPAQAVSKSRNFGRHVLRVIQGAALTLLLLLTVATAGASLLAAFGILPWLEISARFGGIEMPYAGMALQLVFTGFCLSLIFFLPAHWRMARLERSHRRFSINLDDIARAYRIAHTADRAGAFTLSDEFDTMRERLTHMRDHPDLGHLEPELLEVSAQMSFVARDLARTYSDQKIARAKTFLKQRQEELDQVRETVELARQTSGELRRWLADVEAEEREIEKQVARLDADLQEVLPKLGYAIEQTPAATVVPLTKQAKEAGGKPPGA